MKTTIKFPKELIAQQYNSTIISTMVAIVVVVIMLILSHNIINFEENKMLSAAVTCGIILSIVSTGTLSLSLKRDVLASNGSPMEYKIVEFQESEYNNVKECATECRWTDIERYSKMGQGIMMKIEIAYSKDKSFGAYQFFRYVPHNYEACSDIAYLYQGDLSAIN